MTTLVVTCSCATTGDAAVIDFGVWLSGLGDRLDGDGVSEGFELSDGAGLGSGRVAAGVVIGAGIAVELTVLEHVPGRNCQYLWICAMRRCCCEWR